MQVHEGLDGLRTVPGGAVMSIGNFDGVHLGHRNLLAKAAALRQSQPGVRIALVTFEPHPLTVLRPDAAPPRLTPPAIKRALLADSGVDDLVVLPPSRQVLEMTAEAFWKILLEETRPSHLIEGPDFTFGKNRIGTIAALRAWTGGTSIELHVMEPVRVPLLNLQIVPISSSITRWLIGHGRVRDAALCLGRPYTLEGRVVEGFRRGRTIGVPTANLAINGQLIPADGVYAGRCVVDGSAYSTAVSIGITPTFDHEPCRQIEAHLIDFSGDLYGRMLNVELMDWTREQLRFAGVPALKQQLALDISRIRSLVGHRQRPRAVAMT